MYVVLNPSTQSDDAVNDTAETSSSIKNPCSGLASDNEEMPENVACGKLLLAFPGYLSCT
jgi:hypothetical protein